MGFAIPATKLRRVAMEIPEIEIDISLTKLQKKKRYHRKNVKENSNNWITANMMDDKSNLHRWLLKWHRHRLITLLPQVIIQ